MWLGVGLGQGLRLAAADVDVNADEEIPILARVRFRGEEDGMPGVCSGRRPDAAAGPERTSRARRAAAVPRLAERGAAGSIICWILLTVRYCMKSGGPERAN